MESYTLRVKKNTMPTYICPHCETTEKANLTPIKVRDKWTIDFRCSCGSRFAVKTEKRLYRRVTTNLEGRYIVLSDGNREGIMQVLDLSIGGIGFATRTFYVVSVTDRVELTFTLDDEKRSEINKRATVRHVYNNYVGCEFTETLNRDPNFGFYLLS